MDAIEAVKERTLNSRRSTSGGRRVCSAWNAKAPSRAMPAARGAMTMTWSKPPLRPTSVTA